MSSEMRKNPQNAEKLRYEQLKSGAKMKKQQILAVPFAYIVSITDNSITVQGKCEKRLFNRVEMWYNKQVYDLFDIAPVLCTGTGNALLTALYKVEQ